MRALVAYLGWLSEPIRKQETRRWRNQAIDPGKLIPVARLDPERGKLLFLERCANCHAEDGQGTDIGGLRPGPLWGEASWNDGAGMARTATLAGFLRHAMPYTTPGSLTDEEAQMIAAFLTSKPRPAFPAKARDYLREPLPPDAVYYQRR